LRCRLSSVDPAIPERVRMVEVLNQVEIRGGFVVNFHRVGRGDAGGRGPGRGRRACAAEPLQAGDGDGGPRSLDLELEFVGGGRH
jgi:hypothetical protein